MEGLTMETQFQDNSGQTQTMSPLASGSGSAKSPIPSDEESKLSCPSPLVTEPAGTKPI